MGNELGPLPGGDATPDACSTHDGADASEDSTIGRITFHQIEFLLVLCAFGCAWALCEYVLRLHFKGDTMMRHEYMRNAHEHSVRGKDSVFVDEKAPCPR